METIGNVTMSSPRVPVFYRAGLGVLILVLVGGVAFALGLRWAAPMARADEAAPAKGRKAPRVVYPEKTELDFEGMALEGELRSPGEFYFQYRPDEKMDSLVKRRKNFHREMLRDAVLSK
jgi:hypothetical protein